jgi:hypothetical protein
VKQDRFYRGLLSVADDRFDHHLNALRRRRED